MLSVVTPYVVAPGKSMCKHYLSYFRFKHWLHVYNNIWFWSRVFCTIASGDPWAKCYKTLYGCNL